MYRGFRGSCQPSSILFWPASSWCWRTFICVLQSAIAVRRDRAGLSAGVRDFGGGGEAEARARAAIKMDAAAIPEADRWRDGIAHQQTRPERAFECNQVRSRRPRGDDARPRQDAGFADLRSDDDLHAAR